MGKGEVTFNLCAECPILLLIKAGDWLRAKKCEVLLASCAPHEGPIANAFGIRGAARSSRTGMASVSLDHPFAEIVTLRFDRFRSVHVTYTMCLLSKGLTVVNNMNLNHILRMFL